MNPKKPYCRDCGVVKFPETTSVRWTEDGREVFCHLCKVCDARNRKMRRLTIQSIEYLENLLTRHIQAVKEVEEAIKIKGGI